MTDLFVVIDATSFAASIGGSFTSQRELAEALIGR
jgi:hypothetical protein